MSLIWKPLLRKGGLLLAAALVALALADHLGLLQLAPAAGGTPEGMAAGDDLGGAETTAVAQIKVKHRGIMYLLINPTLRLHPHRSTLT